MGNKTVIQETVGDETWCFVHFQVDSGNPFGENNLEHCSKKSRRKPKLINFDLSKKRGI